MPKAKAIKINREPKVWLCIDDGTQKNFFYVNNHGEKSRREPETFQYETLDNGERKYYFRGNCLRCRHHFKHAVIAMGKGKAAFSINLCEACILKTSHLTRIRGNGDRIWSDNKDCPKTFYSDLEAKMLNPDRNKLLKDRAEEAWLHVLRAAKDRRDKVRCHICKARAEAEYEIKSGHYLSWGFGDDFDEYFGSLDDNDMPYEYGVKFYSDGSVYAGPWLSGVMKTTKQYPKGTMTRADGSVYEGQWLAGRKQGDGKQIYSDDTVYIGQFANGFEHGEGVKTYKDGSKFSGRFRFGRRDGQGILTLPNGQQSKGNFRDSLMVHEKPPPDVFEGDMTTFETSAKKVICQPQSLAEICLESIAKSLNPSNKRQIFSSAFVSRRVAEHLKPIISENLLSSLKNISPQYQAVANTIAFKMMDEIGLDRVRMKQEDMVTFIYLAGSNSILKRIRMSTGKLEPSAVIVLGRHLLTRCWPVLESVDISFNTLEYRGLSNLMEGVVSVPTVRKLKLSGCKITPQLSVIVGNIMKNNSTVTDLDLSFNMIGAKGAEAIGKALETNDGLLKLNLRSNDLGYAGGMAIVNGMIRNFNLEIVILTDNKVGDEVITLLTGRLRGNLTQICRSLKTTELMVPELYQLKKEVWEEEEEEDEEEEGSQSSESLLKDDVSIVSERSLTYNELQQLPADHGKEDS